MVHCREAKTLSRQVWGGATTNPVSLVAKTPYDVFVSYAREDDPVWVKRLVLDLRRNYLVVWHDSDLMPGEKWQDGIVTALKSSTACMICIGNQKPTGWFKEEIDLALNIANERGGGLRVFAVLMPRAVDIEVPEFLRNRQYVDFRYREDSQPLVEQIISSIRPTHFSGFEENQQTSAEQLQLQQKQGRLALPDLRGPLRDLKELHEDGLILTATRMSLELDFTSGYF